MAQLEAISVFQQTQINITFFTNYSTVLFDICNSSFCYCLLLANDLLCRNIHHDTEWQQLLFFPPYLQHLFSFLFVDLWNCWQQSCLLLLDFQLTRMRNQEVFSLLYVEYSAALYVFSAISNHLLSQCPQGVKRF